MKQNVNRTSFFLVAVFGAVLAIITGSTLKHEIYVEPYSPGVFVSESKWWGIQVSHFEIRWMKPSGFDDEAWCKQNKIGDWFQFIVEAPDYPDPE